MQSEINGSESNTSKNWREYQLRNKKIKVVVEIKEADWRLFEAFFATANSTEQKADALSEAINQYVVSKSSVEQKDDQIDASLGFMECLSQGDFSKEQTNKVSVLVKGVDYSAQKLFSTAMSLLSEDSGRVLSKIFINESRKIFDKDFEQFESTLTNTDVNLTLNNIPQKPKLKIYEPIVELGK